MGYVYIFGTVLFTVYGQLILKWRIGGYAVLPDGFPQKLLFFARLLIDPYILSGFAAAFIAALFWMAVLAKFDLSYAYPFMSASFVLVFLCSLLFFHEPFTLQKVIGLILIVSGIIVSSR